MRVFSGNHRQAFFAVLASFSILAVTVTAIFADGRPGYQADLNDGGAWLLNRGINSLGHVNRAVREVSSVAGPFSGRYEVSQSGSVVVVNDRGAGQAVLLDTALAQPGASVLIGDTVDVRAAPSSVVLFDQSRGAAWRFEREEFAALESIADLAPQLDLESGTIATVGRDGLVALWSQGQRTLGILRPDGGSDLVETDSLAGDPSAITVVGSTVVALVGGDRLLVVDDGDEALYELPVRLTVLQQPTAEGTTVTGVSAAGELVTVDLATGRIEQDRVNGAKPLDPIVHDGCVWLVTMEPSPVLHYCGQSAQLPTTATEITLSLVNDWVWVNDVQSGAIWFVREDDLELEEVSEWTAALQTNDELDDSSEGGGEEELVENSSAGELSDEVDELDEDDRNEPPRAVDDDYNGRQGRTMVLSVLDNDSDPDNDPLAVTAITGVDASGFTGSGAKVEIIPGGSALQVTPTADFIGSITFGYVVDDGRGGQDEAQVTMVVTPRTDVDNQSPVVSDDNATVRAGRSVSLNLLANDVDPDGDQLILLSVDAEGGQITFAPNGEVMFSPDVTSPEGTIELTYDVADEFGATTTGTARIRVRQANSNQAPQARNDVAATAVGRPAIINVLRNDADPDGDPLVAQSLQTVDGVATDAILTPDGRFIYTPEQPGVYRFTYTVNDGPEIDQAQIRVDVEPADVNHPPVAVVDEVKAAIGESRLVRVLDNDGDPDGDVIGMVDWIGVDGLEIEEVPGEGFFVQPLETAPETTTFTYWISDGLSEPVRGEVVVSALRRPPVDYQPIAVADSFDVRPGQTATLTVLGNDSDPEGQPLKISEPLAQLSEGTLRLSEDGQTLLLKVDESQKFGFQFSYDVEDPAGNRASAVVNVRLVRDGTNRPPVAVPDSVNTPANSPVEVDVLDNDYDPDGDAIVVESIAVQPVNGSVEMGDDGMIVYRPNPGFSGTDTFTYTLVDSFQPPTSAVAVDSDQGGQQPQAGQGGTGDGEDQPAGPGRSLGRVYIGVMSDQNVNRDPVAIDDPSIAVVEVGSRSVTLDVLANDSDPDQDPIGIVEVSAASVGLVEIAGSALRYTPPANGETRTVAFTYTISDGRGGEDSAKVTVELSTTEEPVPPVAVDDRIGPFTGGSRVAFDPRVNDRDPDGSVDQLEVVPISEGLSRSADGGLELIAPETTGEFSYRVRDPQGLESDPAVITILIQENQPPTITPIQVETEFETPIEIDLNTTATDPDGDPLVLTLGANRQGGSVQVVGQPTDDYLRVRFTPDSDFDGTASFDYQVDDRHGHLASAQATVVVLPPSNRPPTAEPINLDGEAGRPVLIQLAQGVSDPDTDGAALHRFTVTDPGDGITLDGPSAGGVVTLSSPVTAGNTTVDFDYTVIDGEESATSTVTVTLQPASFAAPTASPDTIRVLQGESTGSIPVLDNDLDRSPSGLAGEGLIITNVGVSASGRTSFTDRAVSFTPNPGFIGTTTFTYTVQDGRRSVDFQSTGTVQVDVVGRPDTPQPPVVEEVGNQYVVLSWSPPQSAENRGVVTGYELRYTAGGSTRSVSFDTPVTSYRWAGLSNGVQHCFSVAAINEAGQGEFSPTPGNAECGTPDTRPEPIQAPPTVSFGDRELTIAWNAPQNQGSPIVNYQVRMGGGRQALSPELGVALSHTWTGLTNGTDYTFQVRSQNGASDNEGWSEWSPISSPEHPFTVPDAPAQPAAKRGDQQVQVNWREPYDGGDQIIEYQIRSSLSSNWVSVTPQGVTNNYTWEAIPNGTTVSFQIRAINRDPRSTNPGNVSPSSNPVKPCAVPDAPGRPGVTPGDLAATVSWTAPADQGCAITGYQIIASNGATYNASSSARSLVVNGLTNGTSYSFQVAAINEVVTLDGQSPSPSPASASVVPFGVPKAPTNLSTANTGDRQIRISWSEANNNGSPITSYQLRVNGGAWNDIGNTTSVVRNEGTRGATYSYEVRAVNAAGAGSTSNRISATTYNVPGAPRVSATSPAPDKITASWSAPSDGGSPVTGHEASLSSSDRCGASAKTSPGSPTSWGSLSASTRYFVCVRYRNAIGWGDWGKANATTEARCSPFTIWGQSADTVLPGAVIRPEPIAGAGGPAGIGSLRPNQTATALGWRDSGSNPYTDNPSPYNQGIWFELEGGGWVIIAGVRGTSKTDDWAPSNAPPRSAACRR